MLPLFLVEIMTDTEFEKWFMDHLDQMVAMNIYHYNAEKAKEVRAIVEILHPELEALSKRLNTLEKAIKKGAETKTVPTRAKKEQKPKSKWLVAGE